MGKKLELHPKVAEELKGRKVLGFVRGFGLKSLTPTLAVTDTGIFVYDPKVIGAYKLTIPYEQVTGCIYSMEYGVPIFTVTTQSGKTELRLTGSKKDIHEPALNVFRTIRDKLSEMAGVPISESHNKSITKETWALLAPAKLSTVQAKKTEPSPTDQLRQLAELRDAGVITTDDFDSKKADILGRM